MHLRFTSAAPAQANAWLAQARACRTAGHHGAAQLALLEARNSMQQVGSGMSERTMIGNKVRLALEQAKLLGQKESNTKQSVKFKKFSALPMTTIIARVRVAPRRL